MCTNFHASFHAENFNVFEDEALEYLFDACVLANTHVYFHAEDFNVFEGEALEYSFDACALTPMPPSMQRLSMFWRWSIGISV